jgi:hypothetical protein
MKKRRLLICAFVSVFVCLLLLAGCSSDPPVEDKPMDKALKGSWTNRETGNDKRTFTIEEDGHFKALLNPLMGTSYMGWGNVSGKLVQRDGNYTMRDLSGTPKDPGAEWTGLVSSVQGKPVKIELANDEDGKAFFTFSAVGSDSTADQIKTFFGGVYYEDN